MSVSVLILTRNEAVNIEACIASLAFSDDVVVFDSFSTDGTPDLARSAGARVLQREFDSYGEQREAARTAVEWRYPWVLSVDADERVDEELRQEIIEIGEARSTKHAAYRVRRKDYFMGRWIRHATLYPSWFVRFFRPDRVRYPKRRVHEYPEVDGSIGELSGHLIHHSFSKGLASWVDKHNQYSMLEAEEFLSARETPVPWVHVLNGADPVKRRRALKRLSRHLPGRPTLRFLYMYLARGGVWDGWQGLAYCRLLAFYEQLIDLQVEEHRRLQRGDEL